MSLSPAVVDRQEQPYVGIQEVVTMDTFAKIADRLPGVFDWLGEQGVEPAGPPFFRYNLIDMERRLEVEAGVPVLDPTMLDPSVLGPAVADGGMFVGTLPAGRYASVAYIGHPDDLVTLTAELIRWADQEGLAWDMRQTGEGQAWGCRLEIFKTNPVEQPDPNRWETELAFRLADGQSPR